MKRILSLVIFIAALVWTWNIIHTAPAIGFETHSGIQVKLSELITETLSAKKPHAKDLTIMRLWTESLDDNKVRAVFAYKFIEPTSDNEALEQIIEGEAVLHREPSEAAGVDKWVLQSVKTTNDIVVFTEGSVITPDTPSAPPEEGTPAAAPSETH
jgi:hypothetical protein